MCPEAELGAWQRVDESQAGGMVAWKTRGDGQERRTGRRKMSIKSWVSKSYQVGTKQEWGLQDEEQFTGDITSAK